MGTKSGSPGTGTAGRSVRDLHYHPNDREVCTIGEVMGQYPLAGDPVFPERRAVRYPRARMDGSGRSAAKRTAKGAVQRRAVASYDRKCEERGKNPPARLVENRTRLRQRR